MAAAQRPAKCGRRLSETCRSLRPSTGSTSASRSPVLSPKSIVSKVQTTTASTCSSVIVRGAPHRGSSSRPSSLFSTNRLSTNRRRHLPTVCMVTFDSFATAVFVWPEAHVRMSGCEERAPGRFSDVASTELRLLIRLPSALVRRPVVPLCSSFKTAKAEPYTATADRASQFCSELPTRDTRLV